MSKILESLAACELVTEWVSPWDIRLETITGEQPPNRGCLVREDWWLDGESEFPTLATALKRIIVPPMLDKRATAQVTGNLDWNRVILHLRDQSDWAECFPTEDHTEVRTQDGLRAWAGIGLCDKFLGLAVFSQELISGIVEARVQKVPDDIFDQIINI
jgi:hypothetical protein